MPPIRYLLTNTTHEISKRRSRKNVEPIKIVKKKLFTQMFQNFLNAVISIRQDCNSFDKITPNNSSQIDKCKTMYHLK